MQLHLRPKIQRSSGVIGESENKNELMFSGARGYRVYRPGNTDHRTHDRGLVTAGVSYDVVIMIKKIDFCV